MVKNSDLAEAIWVLTEIVDKLKKRLDDVEETVNKIYENQNKEK